MTQCCYKIHRRDPTNFPKYIFYQHSQLFLGHMKDKSSEYYVTGSVYVLLKLYSSDIINIFRLVSLSMGKCEMNDHRLTKTHWLRFSAIVIFHTGQIVNKT